MTMSERSFGAARTRGSGRIRAALRHAAGWAGWPLRFYRARAVMQRLGALDDHALRDMGLTRQDLRDAGATLFDGDPSLILSRRVAERRRRR